jgi:hypothetical protein
VHLLRHSLGFVSYKDCKPVAAALKEIYKALDAGAGMAALDAFEASDWGRKYPAITQSWRRAWAEVIPFYGFAEKVRRIIYTTNSIEALNAKLRRAIRARGHFPNDDAATKLLFLALNRAEKEWTMPPMQWAMATAQFAVIFGERSPGRWPDDQTPTRTRNFRQCRAHGRGGGRASRAPGNRRDARAQVTAPPACLVTRALHTISDFPIILGDTVGRVLRDAYQAAPSGRRTARTWGRSAKRA